MPEEGHRRRVFEAGLGYRKAIYTPFPQAVPKYPVIDDDNCTYFEKGTCKACEKFCPTNAIDFNQKDEIMTVEVGNIILATGYDLFDARRIPQYGYGRLPNVFTSLEFERLSNSAGPTGRQHRPAGRHDRARSPWHRPLRRQPRQEPQQLLLGHLLHAEPEVRPPGARSTPARRSTTSTSTCARPARPTTSSTSASSKRARSSSAARWPKSPTPPALRGRGQAHRPGGRHAGRPAAPHPGGHGHPVGRPGAPRRRQGARQTLRHLVQLRTAGSSSGIPSWTRSRP